MLSPRTEKDYRQVVESGRETGGRSLQPGTRPASWSGSPLQVDLRSAGGADQLLRCIANGPPRAHREGTSDFYSCASGSSSRADSKSGSRVSYFRSVEDSGRALASSIESDMGWLTKRCGRRLRDEEVFANSDSLSPGHPNRLPHPFAFGVDDASGLGEVTARRLPTPRHRTRCATRRRAGPRAPSRPRT